MAVIGTAGHVDHGKSSLVERLTGIDPDRFEEEKRRGLTIDLGFAWLTLPSGREAGLVDVPGHERFIRNMLAGAGGISACLFVVAANEGWMPQSAEHLAIVDALGVGHGVVALTKADLVEENELGRVRADVEARLGTTTLAGAPIVACSVVTGSGLDELTHALDRVLDAAGPPTDEDRPRMWVDRVFTIKGAGTVVTGTLAGGGLREGDEVVLSPDGVRARIRSIQTHKKRVNDVKPATRVALNLAGLDRTRAGRGDAIVRPNEWRPTRQVDAVVRVLPAWATGNVDHELTARGSHLLYVGSAEVPVRVRLLEANKISAGQRSYARLTLREPLPLQRGDRFVLRDAGRVLTFGGGEVLDPLPGRANADLLRALDGNDPRGVLSAIVSAEGSIPRDEALFRSRARTIGDDVAELGRSLVSDKRLGSLLTQLYEIVDMHHREHPLAGGVPKEAARASSGLDARAFDDLIARAEEVIEEETILRRRDHRVRLSEQQTESWRSLRSLLEEARFTPPLETDLRIDRDLLHALVGAGEIVKISNFYLTRDNALEAQQMVRDLIERAGSATVADIRDALATSRKYAVPLCEWLDATGTTIRRGDVRVLGPRAASLPR